MSLKNESPAELPATTEYSDHSFARCECYGCTTYRKAPEGHSQLAPDKIDPPTRRKDKP